MKRLLSFVLALLLVFPLSFAVSAEKDAIYDLALDSQGVYVFNVETGTAIYEKAENSRMFPASTTKIMTALLILEECKDPTTEFVTVPDTAMFSYIVEDGGMNAQLVEGETFSVYDLLAGLMIRSYCDVGDLLAYHFEEGDVSAFVSKMNEKAKELGLENTHFENTHGLHSPNHYSSPKDIALLLAKAVENDLFREIISLRDYTIPATEHSKERKLKHTVDIYNEKSDYYLDAFVGGKSGTTGKAGRCLATYSEKDGVSYVSVLLGSNLDPNRNYSGNMSYLETHTLVSYAYENFELKTVLEKGEKVGKISVIDGEKTLPVVAGESITLLSRKNTEAEFKINLPHSISAEKIKDGAQVGKVNLIFNGEESQASYPLLLSWDGVPVTTKSKVQKGAENAWDAVVGIFKTDRVFLTLLIMLLVVVAVCIPAMKITKLLHVKKSHRPKH